MLIFVQSKERAKELYKELAFDDIKVDVVHADLTQQQVSVGCVFIRLVSCNLEKNSKAAPPATGMSIGLYMTSVVGLICKPELTPIMQFN